ncbi:hypothetical protein Barb7_02446 [Bacteroidales bacterium Barb7]|nr:hypothetical protein Barb7_02446 [Bacteroidales bacterium Barb7]
MPSSYKLPCCAEISKQAVSNKPTDKMNDFLFIPKTIVIIYRAAQPDKPAAIQPAKNKHNIHISP